VEHRVTSRDPQKPILAWSHFDDAVNKETIVTQNQDDISGNDLAGCCAFNRQQIARPQGGKHACSPRPEPNGAATA
jgi:hypothetical protein